MKHYGYFRCKPINYILCTQTAKKHGLFWTKNAKVFSFVAETHIL